MDTHLTLQVLQLVVIGAALLPNLDKEEEKEGERFDCDFGSENQTKKKTATRNSKKQHDCYFFLFKKESYVQVSACTLAIYNTVSEQKTQLILKPHFGQIG